MSYLTSKARVYGLPTCYGIRVTEGVAETITRTQPDTTVRPHRHVAWLAVGAGVAFLLLFLCYFRLSETYALNADGSSNSLEAWAMLHGNWLLRSWTVTDVSFYTTELPEYVIVEALRGLNPGDVHIASAITYALLVVFAGLLAKGSASGRAGWTRALVASGIMLAPQLGLGLKLLLSQPDHLGTQVPVLIVFLVLDRFPRRWYTPVAIGVLLTWVIIADSVAILEAALPIAAVCAARVAWSLLRTRRALTARWFELSLIAAAAVATGAGELAVRVIPRLGGFRELSVPTSLAKSSQIPEHLWLTVQGTLTLFGADVVGSPSGAQTAFAWLHMIGVALAVIAIVFAFRGLLRDDDLLTPVLAVGLVITLLFFEASIIPRTVWDIREVSAILPFGAVLAGRLLAGWVHGSGRSSIRDPRSQAKGKRRKSGVRRTVWLIPVLSIVLVGYVASLAYGMAQPKANDTEFALAGWLEQHHLSTGLGTYTEDNPTTVDSDGHVNLLTVSWQPTGPSVPRWYQSSLSWYNPRTHYANFVVTNSAEGKASLIPRHEIRSSFGNPAHTYHFKTFTIMVWDKNLLKDLGPRSSTLPGKLGLQNRSRRPAPIWPTAEAVQ